MIDYGNDNKKVYCLLTLIFKIDKIKIFNQFNVPALSKYYLLVYNSTLLTFLSNFCFSSSAPHFPSELSWLFCSIYFHKQLVIPWVLVFDLSFPDETLITSWGRLVRFRLAQYYSSLNPSYYIENDILNDIIRLLNNLNKWYWLNVYRSNWLNLISWYKML